MKVREPCSCFSDDCLFPNVSTEQNRHLQLTELSTKKVGLIFLESLVCRTLRNHLRLKASAFHFRDGVLGLSFFGQYSRILALDDTLLFYLDFQESKITKKQKLPEMNAANKAEAGPSINSGSNDPPGILYCQLIIISSSFN